MDISQMLDKIKSQPPEDLKLYFITRILKEGVKTRDKVLQKYIFNVHQVEVDMSIKEYLSELSIKQFEKILKNQDLEFHDYDVCNDDSQHILTYQMENKVMSFSDVVFNQLNKVVPKITNLNEILSGQTLWAYCVGYESEDNEPNFYTFRKVTPTKVGVDKKEEAKKTKSLVGMVRTIFDTDTSKLILQKGETIQLEKGIDCVFSNDTFYVLKKKAFESIVGLQEEYKNQANNFVTSLIQNDFFGDVSLIKEEIENTPALHRKLVRLQKTGNALHLKKKDITTLKRLGKKTGTMAHIKDGKIIFESPKDIENTIKLLSDFYKTGDFSGKGYETFAGKESKR